MTPVPSSHRWGCLKPGAAHLHWWGSRSSTTHTERSTSMAREKPTIFWGCDHHCPIEVVAAGDGKRARCLGCGACGPVRAAGEDAMLALRAETRHREKMGA